MNNTFSKGSKVTAKISSFALSNRTNTTNNSLINNCTNYSPHGIGENISRYGFNGEMLLSNKNNSYFLGNGNRLYIGSIRIFNQKDRLNILKGGAINSYSYASHDSINKFDPSGNSSTGFYVGNSIGIIAGIVGVVLAIPTGGASLTLSAGVAISLESAGILTTVASIGLYIEGDQEAANIAGWVAAGLGLGSLATSSVSSITKNLDNITSKLYKTNGNLGVPLGKVGAKATLSSSPEINSPSLLRGGGETPNKKGSVSSKSKSRMSNSDITQEEGIVSTASTSSIYDNPSPSTSSSPLEIVQDIEPSSSSAVNVATESTRTRTVVISDIIEDAIGYVAPDMSRNSRLLFTAPDMNNNVAPIRERMSLNGNRNTIRDMMELENFRF